jgi:hypothetical protein
MTKTFFSRTWILTNLKRSLQSNNLDKLIFVSKNWHIDFKINLHTPFSLVVLLMKRKNKKTIIHVGLLHGIYKKQSC